MGIDWLNRANSHKINLRPWLKNADEENEWKAEQVLAQRMGEKKVYITTGESLTAEEPGWFRIIFSQEEAVLREGLKRVFEAIGPR